MATIEEFIAAAAKVDVLAVPVRQYEDKAANVWLPDTSTKSLPDETVWWGPVEITWGPGNECSVPLDTPAAEIVTKLIASTEGP